MQSSPIVHYKPQVDQFRGHEKILVEKYIDVDLLDKDSYEAKSARFQLGLGMPELRAFNKRSNCQTFREHLDWYQKSILAQGTDATNNELQKAICSH